MFGKHFPFQTRLPGQQAVGGGLYLLPAQGESRVASTTSIDIFFMLQSLLQLLKITAVRQLA